MINPYYITGLDKELLAQLSKTHKTVVTLEDGVLDGGFGQKIAAYYAEQTPRCCATACKKNSWIATMCSRCWKKTA